MLQAKISLHVLRGLCDDAMGGVPLPKVQSMPERRQSARTVWKR